MDPRAPLALGIELGIEISAFEAEFHLHVPAGAIAKDGPSAGIACKPLPTGTDARCAHRRGLRMEV